jgi:hypothetical protein
MFNLIISYYHSPNDERQTELNQCLINNSKSPHIKSIFLLNSQIFDLDFIDQEYRHKIVQFTVDDENRDRLHYDCAIQFTNNYLCGQKCIVSNSDIYFDETLNHLDSVNFSDNITFALSKYENEVLSERIIDSQDSWIFVSPLKVDLSLLKFKFGIPGCDNIFAGIMVKSGYRVFNPCKTIKIHHLHESNYRTYNESERLQGEYWCVIPCELTL